MRFRMAAGLFVSVLAIAGVPGPASPAGSSENEISVNPATGEIRQVLPDLSDEPHDEDALRAEGARETECLKAHGMIDIRQTFDFVDREVTHMVSYRPEHPELLTPSQRNAIDLKCSARLAVLMSDYEPEDGE